MAATWIQPATVTAGGPSSPRADHWGRAGEVDDSVLQGETEHGGVAPESSDPTVVNAIAVTVEDVVAAVEMNRTSARQAVLRLTPPFSGRMRARLHVEQGEPYAETPEPIHILPGDLLADDAPSYPRPADTGDELRADPAVEYTVERHRERHAAAADAWREAVPRAIRDELTLETHAGSWRVTVSTLGDPPKRAESDE